MSFLLGFNAWKAYQQTCIKGMPHDPFSDHIKSAMQPFLDKVGIRKDLTFIEWRNPNIFVSAGTNIFKNGDAAVMVAPGSDQVDKEGCIWCMKHEISHIKHNDNFTMKAVPCICEIAAYIFGTHSLSLPLSSVIAPAVIVGGVSEVLFSRWREAKADDFSIENSSDEELKGGRRFLVAQQEKNIEKRTTFWKRIVISASGNDRRDITHPSLTSRIRKIEGALRARNVDIDRAEERLKID